MDELLFFIMLGFMILLTISVSVLSIILYKKTNDDDDNGTESDKIKITEIECRCDGEEERWTRLLDRLFEQKCGPMNKQVLEDKERDIGKDADLDLINYGKSYEYDNKYTDDMVEEKVTYPIPPATISSNNKRDDLYGSSLQYDPNEY
jgi:hypothetical protein